MDGAGDHNPLHQIWVNERVGYRDLSSALLRIAYYSKLFLAPNGKVFLAGPERLSRYLRTGGTGSWEDVGFCNAPVTRTYGSAVMYAPGKVLYAGGGLPTALKTAEIIDLTTTSPRWVLTAPMAFARRHLNLTLLPDGTVLATGGTADRNSLARAVYTPELWDPQRGAWTKLADAQKPRLYHSTALLLADGRVLTAGGNEDSGGINVFETEIFSPPYLLKGARPSISRVTTPSGGTTNAVNLAGSLHVITAQAPDIRRVTLIGLSSVTHTANMGQRFIELSFARASADTLTVQFPSNPHVCPPGWYMLFVLNSNGVPSRAAMIRRKL